MGRKRRMVEENFWIKFIFGLLLGIFIVLSINLYWIADGFLSRFFGLIGFASVGYICCKFAMRL